MSVTHQRQTMTTQRHTTRQQQAQMMPDVLFGPKVGFFFKFVFFVTLTNVLRLYLCFESAGRFCGGGDDNNRPKQRQTRHLGPRCVFIFISTCFVIYFFYNAHPPTPSYVFQPPRSTQDPQLHVSTSQLCVSTPQLRVLTLSHLF